jgi:hypothetical protein
MGWRCACTTGTVGESGTETKYPESTVTLFDAEGNVV